MAIDQAALEAALGKILDEKMDAKIQLMEQKIDTKLEHVASSCKVLEQAMVKVDALASRIDHQDQLLKDLVHRLGLVESGSTGTSSFAGSETSWPALSQASKLQRSSADTRVNPRSSRASSTGPPAALHEVRDMTVVWLSGAGRPLSKKHWEQIGTRVLGEHCSDELVAQVAVKGMHLQDRCRFEFPDEDTCKKFLDSFIGGPSTFVDEHHDKQVKKLRVRRDQTISERDFGRFMGACWQLMKVELEKVHEGRFPPDTKLGTSGGYVVLHKIKDGEMDPYVLMAIRTDRDKSLDKFLHIKPDYSNCLHFGISREVADGIVAAAKRLADRVAVRGSVHLGPKPSDHRPVAACLAAPLSQPPAPTIPQWVCSHPAFQRIAADLHERGPNMNEFQHVSELAAKNSDPWHSGGGDPWSLTASPAKKVSFAVEEDEEPKIKKKKVKKMTKFEKSLLL